MKAIIGLGNPGSNYTDSRHNIGFSIVRTLSKIYKIVLKKDKDIISLSGKGKINGQNVLLALPLTFMNLSGIAVAPLLRKYKIDLEKLLIVCDDLDLDLGVMRMRSSGSSGGHRGLKSIIDSVGNQAFPRLRIGIGRPLLSNTVVSEYVLSPFTKKEKEIIKGTIENACDCCRVWVIKDIKESMNIFNRRSK